MQTQQKILDYRIDWYFDNYKLVIENDENEHSGRNIDNKIEIKKPVENELGANVH